MNVHIQCSMEALVYSLCAVRHNVMNVNMYSKIMIVMMIV